MVDHLRQNFEGNVWVVGGTQLQNYILEHNLLNSLEIFVMPVLLGEGIPLFPSFKSNVQQLKSIQSEMIENTIIKTTYIF
ncbi:dihydrofolate reductase family protein [Acinetobacter sp. WCHAc060033]|uniref:dihydrofolate reductase family protein n=1 Tax=Acinetobacter sp. WCHAc060033 TaxID=2518624 RepID=UPI0022490F6B|nr:dihydrofolate reductase family protein [Acinetobacter sp. WCHAc060033]